MKKLGFCIALIVLAGCASPNYEKPKVIELSIDLIGSAEMLVTPIGDSILAVPVSLATKIVLYDGFGNVDVSSLYIYPVDIVSKIRPHSKVQLTYVTTSVNTPKPLLRVKTFTAVTKS